MTTARARNRQAFATIHKIAPPLTPGPEAAAAQATKPLITARTTSPMTSSATAAPRMMRASLVLAYRGPSARER